MNEPLDLNKKRTIPEVTYSVVENLGWDARDKKQRTVGTITQLQFIDLQERLEKEKKKKLMSMNLFDLHDYIESVENRVGVLEELVSKDNNQTHFQWGLHNTGKVL